MIERFRNLTKMIEYELVADVHREEGDGSKEIKEWHGCSEYHADIETDQNHSIVCLEIKLLWL